MAQCLSYLLKLPGVHYALTRYGSAPLKHFCFDEKYQSGTWSFDHERPELAAVVEKYASGGNILMLGCGTAAIAGMLKAGNYDSFLGVDISVEAIKRAAKYASAKVQFAVADMCAFAPKDKYNVILFAESLYYVHALRRNRMLRRYLAYLNEEGRMIATIAQPKRYASLLNSIRKHFHVTEDRRVGGNSARHLIVFH